MVRLRLCWSGGGRGGGNRHASVDTQMMQAFSSSHSRDTFPTVDKTVPFLKTLNSLQAVILILYIRRVIIDWLMYFVIFDYFQNERINDAILCYLRMQLMFLTPLFRVRLHVSVLSTVSMFPGEHVSTIIRFFTITCPNSFEIISYRNSPLYSWRYFCTKKSQQRYNNSLAVIRYLQQSVGHYVMLSVHT